MKSVLKLEAAATLLCSFARAHAFLQEIHRRIAIEDLNKNLSNLFGHKFSVLLAHLLVE
ncbi:hypothetical protein [Undibacterium sp. Tian12W]|uniref:hypothetical protein n=1 Tax=Undibacterium sp. Tian12W TaxID=3413054 RepID=UPI003BF3101B